MTQAEDDIKTRFFQALDFLKDQKVIRGIGTFCREYNLDRADYQKSKIIYKAIILSRLYGLHTWQAMASPQIGSLQAKEKYLINNLKL